MTVNKGEEREKKERNEKKRKGRKKRGKDGKKEEILKINNSYTTGKVQD